MSEKVAIITGAGGAIGRASAVELARLGFHCVLVGRTQSTLRETASLCRQGLVIPADVTKISDVDSIVQQTLKAFGRIDALINNAGIAPAQSIEQTTPELWHQIVDTNLSAAFYLCRAVWGTFKNQQGGVVVNISSWAARDPFPGLAAYGAAKAGLNTLGLALAREGTAIGVRVHTLALGAVETPMLRNLVSKEQFPSDNTLEPADVAHVVGQLVSGELRHTSGEVIWLAKHP